MPVITTIVNGRRARVIRARSLRPGDWIVAPRSSDRLVVGVGLFNDGRVLVEHSARPEDDQVLRGSRFVFIAPRSVDA